MIKICRSKTLITDPLSFRLRYHDPALPLQSYTLTSKRIYRSNSHSVFVWFGGERTSKFRWQFEFRFLGFAKNFLIRGSDPPRKKSSSQPSTRSLLSLAIQCNTACILMLLWGSLGMLYRSLSLPTFESRLCFHSESQKFLTPKNFRVGKTKMGQQVWWADFSELTVLKC